MLTACSTTVDKLNPIHVVHMALGTGSDESDSFLRSWIRDITNGTSRLREQYREVLSVPCSVQTKSPVRKWFCSVNCRYLCCLKLCVGWKAKNSSLVQ